MDCAPFRRAGRESATPFAVPAACSWENTVPVSFWLTLILFAVVGFMLLNGFYWKNQRDEHEYRVKKWKAARRASE
jgi:hypothetical protein